VPSHLFLVFTFTLPSPSGSHHLLLSYFLATLQFFSLPTILLPKERKRRVGKLSKCLSLYCKLWATVVHSRGTLESCVVRSTDENSLRGCSFPKKKKASRYADQAASVRVKYWISSTHTYSFTDLLL
jgi:hypothetical protein